MAYHGTNTQYTLVCMKNVLSAVERNKTQKNIYKLLQSMKFIDDHFHSIYACVHSGWGYIHRSAHTSLTAREYVHIKFSLVSWESSSSGSRRRRRKESWERETWQTRTHCSIREASERERESFKLAVCTAEAKRCTVQAAGRMTFMDSARERERRGGKSSSSLLFSFALGVNCARKASVKIAPCRLNVVIDSIRSLAFLISS